MPAAAARHARAVRLAGSPRSCQPDRATARCARRSALTREGFEGYLSLEPHLAMGGRHGGFSGPEGFHRAARALKELLAELSLPWR